MSLVLKEIIYYRGQKISYFQNGEIVKGYTLLLSLSMYELISRYGYVVFKLECGLVSSQVFQEVDSPSSYVLNSCGILTVGGKEVLCFTPANSLFKRLLLK